MSYGSEFETMGQERTFEYPAGLYFTLALLLGDVKGLYIELGDFLGGNFWRLPVHASKHSGTLTP